MSKVDKSTVTRCLILMPSLSTASSKKSSPHWISETSSSLLIVLYSSLTVKVGAIVWSTS